MRDGLRAKVKVSYDLSELGAAGLRQRHANDRGGATLCTEIRFDRAATEIERSCIAWALDQIDHLGARSGSGMGRIDIQHDGDPSPYADWLDETHPEELIQRLVRLADGFGTKKRGKK
jgi:hypothetical protein